MEPNESQFGKIIKNIRSVGEADRSMLDKWAAGEMSAKDYSRKALENMREKESAEFVLANTPLQNVTSLAQGSDTGYEVSGDALARAKKGKPIKVER